VIGDSDRSRDSVMGEGTSKPRKGDREGELSGSAVRLHNPVILIGEKQSRSERSEAGEGNREGL
jgi:hypothetical protein